MSEHIIEDAGAVASSIQGFFCEGVIGVYGLWEDLYLICRKQIILLIGYVDSNTVCGKVLSKLFVVSGHFFVIAA